MKKSYPKNRGNKGANVDTVFVFYNSPNAIKFLLEKKSIEIQGAPLSELYSPSGQRLTQGKFGITEVAREDWEAIEKMYGDMKIFKSSLIYASNTKDYGSDRAKEQASQLNGNEQVSISSAHSSPEN